ncbi:MAG: hypothetical protein OHK0023_07100 [Anaerolineae bacterium]
MTHITVIEDNAQNARLVKKVLDAAGYKVTVCETGEDGLTHVFAQTPELVLIDLGLPDIDGQTVIALMRQQTALAHTKIIAFTAFPESMAQSMAKAYGCDGVIVKPFDTRKLAEQIAAFLAPTSAAEESKPAESPTELPASPQPPPSNATPPIETTPSEVKLTPSEPIEAEPPPRPAETHPMDRPPIAQVAHTPTVQPPPIVATPNAPTLTTPVPASVAAQSDALADKPADTPQAAQEPAANALSSDPPPADLSNPSQTEALPPHTVVSQQNIAQTKLLESGADRTTDGKPDPTEQ